MLRCFHCTPSNTPSTSTFPNTFYRISTFDGFDKNKHKNYWGFIRATARDFLKGLFQDWMKTLADIWSRWVTMMLKAAATKAWGGIGDLWSGGGGNIGYVPSEGMVAHTGGLVTAAGLKRFHTGGLNPDERMIIAQTNEGIISRQGMRNLAMLNSGRFSANAQPTQAVTHNHFYINALDPQSWSDFVRKNPGPVLDAYSRDMRMAGGTRSAGRAYL